MIFIEKSYYVIYFNYINAAFIEAESSCPD